MVQDKTGLDEDKARMAVTLVLNQVKGKLPAPAQGYIDTMLSNKESSGGGLADTIKGGLGGMLG